MSADVSAMVSLFLVGAAAVLLWPAGRPRTLGHLMTASRVVVLHGWLKAMPTLPVGNQPHRNVIETGLAVLTAGLLAAAMAGPVAALLAAVCAGIAASAVRAKRAAGVTSARRGAELEVLAGLGAELRSGRHPAAALSAVQTPADDELEVALSAARATARLGGDVSASLRRGGAGAALSKLAAAWQLSEECGAPLADMVAQVAGDVQAIVDLHRDAQIELTGARATGVVLAVLPLLGVALGAAMGAHPMHVLLHTPAGAVCGVGGLTFELAGLAWVRRLTNGTRRCRQ